jgi:hypothetical protein
MLVSPEIYAIDRNHCIGTLDRTLIQIWRGVAATDAMTEMNRIARRLIEADPFPATCLFIVEATAPPPESEPRKQLAKFSSDAVSRMKFAVVVAEGSGFRAAIVRAVGTTLTTLSPHRSHFKFVGDVPAAASMLEPHLAPRTGGAKGLIAGAEELRRKIDAQVYKTRTDSAAAAGSDDESSRRRPPPG